METKNLIITPRTKVLELIQSYPQLEDIIVNYVPAFKVLKNPVLRRTVAKVATLQQAASVGNVDLAHFIHTLRKEVGQETESEIIAGSEYNTVKPVWYDESKVEKQLDVREMLAEGEHPVGQVVAELTSLPDGAIYKLIAPFLPAPLVDKASSLGFKHWVKQIDDEIFEIFFHK